MIKRQVSVSLTAPVCIYCCVICRRGSNVSLVLDMSALGSVEPLNCGVTTPREGVAQEYLQSAGRVLTRQQLRDTTLNTQALHTEFAVSHTPSTSSKASAQTSSAFTYTHSTPRYRHDYHVWGQLRSRLLTHQFFQHNKPFFYAYVYVWQ